MHSMADDLRRSDLEGFVAIDWDVPSETASKTDKDIDNDKTFIGLEER